jgi:hypothetical protein
LTTAGDLTYRGGWRRAVVLGPLDYRNARRPDVVEVERGGVRRCPKIRRCRCGSCDTPLAAAGALDQANVTNGARMSDSQHRRDHARPRRWKALGERPNSPMHIPRWHPDGSSRRVPRRRRPDPVASCSLSEVPHGSDYDAVRRRERPAHRGAG